MAKAVPCQPTCHRIPDSFEGLGPPSCLGAAAGQRRPDSRQLCHTTTQRRASHAAKGVLHAAGLARAIAFTLKWQLQTETSIGSVNGVLVRVPGGLHLAL